MRGQRFALSCHTSHAACVAVAAMSNPFVRDQQWRKFVDELFCSTTKGVGFAPGTLPDQTEKHRSAAPAETIHLTEAMLDERKRISIASQIEFLSEASRALDDERLGLTLAKQLDLREIGMIYYLAASSYSFGDARRRIVRYARVVSEASELRIDRRGTNIKSGHILFGIFQTRRPTSGS